MPIWAFEALRKSLGATGFWPVEPTGTILPAQSVVTIHPQSCELSALALYILIGGQTHNDRKFRPESQRFLSNESAGPAESEKSAAEVTGGYDCSDCTNCNGCMVANRWRGRTSYR
jgi:hypothetical protein